MNVRLYFVDDKHIITFQLGIKVRALCDIRWAVDFRPQSPYSWIIFREIVAYTWENIWIYFIRNSRILEPLPWNSCIEMKSAFVDTCTVVHHSHTFSSRFTHPTTDAMISNLLYSGCIYSVYLKVFYFESACFQVFYLESACYM